MPAHRTRDIQQSSRSLEVTTAQPPTLAIISPTPRAFTFPINHDLHDSPYSSPSASPFEPDLGPLALTSCTPPPPPPQSQPEPAPARPQPHLIRTLSPPISSSLPSPLSHMTHKRRKSSSSDIIERRPKKGDEDYVKRPENAFILFRRKCCEDRQAAHEEAAAADAPTKKQRQADLSKTISQQWKSLPAEERQYWEDLAKEKKKEHEAMYPNYVYRPQRIKDGKSKGKKMMDLKGGRRGSLEHEFETDNESVSFILPFTTPLTRQHGRSASAPTPPLGYQQIVVPNVYMPSCPTSPSLMPMIARRSSHPGHPGGHFDYLPRESSLMPPPAYAQEFQPPLHSTDFFQDMFNMTGQASPSLHRLTVPEQPLLQSGQQTISPSSSIASGSSGPPSPHSGPYTPSLFAAAPSSCDDFSSNPNSAVELQLPDLVDYPIYGWENNLWEGGAASAAAEMLIGEDFDLASIPPIELGLSKMGGDDLQLGGSAFDGTTLVDEPYHHHHHHHHHANHDHARHESLDGLFGYEEMMAAGHGY